MEAAPTALFPKRSRMASTAAVASCHDCSRAVALWLSSASPSPRSKESWSTPPAARPEALTPRRRMPSPGSTPDSSAAATCPMAPPVAIGRSRVCERDCSDRSLNLTLTVIVRAELDAPRSMVATDSAMRSTWRSSSCGSTRSWLKVSSCPIDLLGRFGLTGSGSSPRDSAARWAPLALPRRRTTVSSGQRRQVAHRLHAQVVQALRRRRAHAPQRLDGVPVQEGQLVLRLDQVHARARLAGRPGWPAAWPPARPAWRSSWSARCRRRTPGGARRAPAGAGPARCAPATRAGARRRPRPRTPRPDRSARPWA